MSLVIGSRLGSYEIVGKLGAGGMGEVYRARDTELDRYVAIKILPENFAADPDRLRLFQREARTLASLNHPNIAHIYGLEQSGSVKAIVLELVEGLTLEERIAQAPIPVADAMKIAKQIADAIDAAHEKGVVHRDLKPANIKLGTDGTVKVLDFGIATAVARSDEDASVSSLRTEMSDGTRVIVGTARYMSPEQASGQVVDKRTDVWSFGCILYEMLTTHPAFPGETASDTIAAILHKEPDWSRLPKSTPAILRRLIARCLVTEPRRRLRDIGDAKLDLDEALAEVASVEVKDTAPGAWSRRVAPAAAAIASVVALVWALNQRSEPRPDVTRTSVTLPANQQLDIGGGALPLALSPDGRRLVFAAQGDGRTQLYLRALDSFDAVPLEGTEGARYPFFSPDGRSIGFFSAGQLKSLSLDGGALVLICDVPSFTAAAGDRPRGATWAADGTIVFDPGRSGLMQVAADGGTPAPLTSNDAAMDARDLSWPSFLPGGKALLVTVSGLPADGASSVAVLSLETGEWLVVTQGSQATYLPSGHFVFHAAHVREGELQVLPFDAKQEAATGPPTSVLNGVFRSADAGGVYYAVSRSGTLAFARGGLAHTLVRVDRNGRRVPLLEERRGFRFPRLSPDGQRLAVTIDPRPSEVWVYDLMRRTRVLLSSEGHSLLSAWTPDGRRIAYNSAGSIFWRPADASGPAELLLSGERESFPDAWTRDGTVLVLHRVRAGAGNDVMTMSKPGETEPLIATPANEYNTRLSRDGRWLAYASDESGRLEVYVRPFPNVDAGRWAISTEGGHSPAWSPNGRELLYMSGTTLWSVPFEVEDAVFVPGTAVPLFSGPFDSSQDGNFDVFSDGDHFVMVEVDVDTRPTQVQIIANWATELLPSSASR